MQRLLVATALFLAGTSSSLAENGGKPPFQFSSHGISVLSYQGRKITSDSDKKIKLGKPASMSCAGPLSCMVKVDGAIDSDASTRLYIEIGPRTSRPYAGGCFNGPFASSRIVPQGDYVVIAKASLCSTMGGQISDWEVHYTLYDPNLSQKPN